MAAGSTNLAQCVSKFLVHTGRKLVCIAQVVKQAAVITFWFVCSTLHLCTGGYDNVGVAQCDDLVKESCLDCPSAKVWHDRISTASWALMSG